MRILFVCTGNTCRSPMAEGILKHLLDERQTDIEVYSAGIFAEEDGPISDHSIRAMEEIGIDISDYRSTGLDEEGVKKADIILTMGNSHKRFIEEKYDTSLGKTFTLLEYVYGFKSDIVDPYGGDLEIYKRTRDEIYQAIRELEL